MGQKRDNLIVLKQILLKSVYCVLTSVSCMILSYRCLIESFGCAIAYKKRGEAYERQKAAAGTAIPAAASGVVMHALHKSHFATLLLGNSEDSQ